MTLSDQLISGTVGVRNQYGRLPAQAGFALCGTIAAVEILFNASVAAFALNDKGHCDHLCLAGRGIISLANSTLCFMANPLAKEMQAEFIENELRLKIF